jgi:hypothetical protein
MATVSKAEEAQKLVKKANKYISPSFLDFRLKPDWEAAAPLLDKACLLFKVEVRAGQAMTAILNSHATSQTQVCAASLFCTLQQAGEVDKALETMEKAALAQVGAAMHCASKFRPTRLCCNRCLHPTCTGPYQISLARCQAHGSSGRSVQTASQMGEGGLSAMQDMRV